MRLPRLAAALPLSALALALPLSAADEAPWVVSEPHGPAHGASLDLDEGTWMSVSAHGDQLAFDLLGDLWVMPITGGEARPLRTGPAWEIEPAWSPDGARIAFTSDASGNEQIWTMAADGSDARPLTDEGEARVTEPTWDPAGDWIVARRRTVDTRSIGVTELYQYHLDGGAGIPLTALEEHPHAGEPQVTDRYVYFSSRAGRFEYNHNPLQGLWSVLRLDRQRGGALPVAWGSGSAARPTLSPDRSQLAIISRDRTKTLLEIVDLATGRRRAVADWLDRDQLEGFALHGTYPRMDWSAPDRIILWAGGKLWRLDPATGQKAQIPFHLKGDWTLHDVPRAPIPVPETVQAKVIRWQVESPDGALAFSAMGRLWLQRPGPDRAQPDRDRPAPEAISPGTGYAPAWSPASSPGGPALAWTSWDDASGGALHLTRFSKGYAKPVTETVAAAGLNGQLLNPAWRQDGQAIVLLRAPEGGTSPDLIAAPYYEIVVVQRDLSARGAAKNPDKAPWIATAVGTTANRGPRTTRPFWHQGRIWLFEEQYPAPRSPEQIVLLSLAADGSDRREHVHFDAADEIVPSPDFRFLAYKSRHKAYLTAFPHAPGTVEAAALPTELLTERVGDWLSWSPDSKRLSWMEADTRRTLAVDRVQPAEDGKDGVRPGIASAKITVALPRATPATTLVLTRARLLTMKGAEILTDATVIIERDRIKAILPPGAPLPALPADAQTIDLSGKTVIPGLIDVHAHLHYTAGDVLPAQEWRYLTSLDFGVTTVHDPSASTDLVFTQAERVEAGLMRGPRVYSTGFVLYGALSNQGAETPTREAARDHLQRLRDLGARSAKIYQQSQRDRRQWYADACRALDMLCVAEGGGDLWQNLTMYADGFHAVEHSMPGPHLYRDVVQFTAASRTASTLGTANSPTLLVAYNAVSGENWFYQNLPPVNDERLLRHYPRRELDSRAWRLDMMLQPSDWAFQDVARDAAHLARAGVLVTLGAHGQLQGLGAHWELWAMAGATGEGGAGAMTPAEALQAATISGARYLGLDQQLGSIEPGKLADLVVLNSDPLQDIRRSTDIAFTIKNGEIYR